MTIKFVAAAAVAAAAFSTAAMAQDFSLNPNFGEVSLTAGFAPDPYQVSVIAGGGIDASMTIGGECVGNISDAPDFRVNYTAGGFGLWAGVVSDADTTLIVNGPDGSWFCADDVDGLNPIVGGAGPQSGQYDIWIGTYGEMPAEAVLYITEIDPN
ncbi:peptidase S1 [Maricaulis sp.]|uniref:peptidase S1 n=1 Tax=Maricaulis sp. TaxID=1486257 RepID=UPI00260D39EC|nr:peptidase S1 [Maricaulis sp.]